MDPVALNAQKYYPLPNGPGLPFTHQNNFVVQAAYPQPQDRIEFKIDHDFNDRRRMFGRYTHMDSVYSKPNFWGNIGGSGLLRSDEPAAAERRARLYQYPEQHHRAECALRLRARLRQPLSLEQWFPGDEIWACPLPSSRSPTAMYSRRSRFRTSRSWVRTAATST